MGYCCVPFCGSWKCCLGECCSRHLCMSNLSFFSSVVLHFKFMVLCVILPLCNYLPPIQLYTDKCQVSDNIHFVYCIRDCKWLLWDNNKWILVLNFRQISFHLLRTETLDIREGIYTPMACCKFHEHSRAGLDNLCKSFRSNQSGTLMKLSWI